MSRLAFFCLLILEAMTHFFNTDCLNASDRTARVGRAAERASHTLFRALEARNAAMQDARGGADMPAPRAPRTQRRAARKPAGGGEDGDGDDPALADLVNALIEKIATLSKPSIAVDVALWDVATIANYLHRSESVVRERVVCAPSFPAAIRLPNATGQKMQPLWEAHEVIAWARSHKERKSH